LNYYYYYYYYCYNILALLTDEMVIAVAMGFPIIVVPAEVIVNVRISAICEPIA
jgi:hypothetical protein